MVKCLAAFLDFCYIARRNTITTDDLNELEDALARFHILREVFVGTAGVNGDYISLPHQHALLHYLRSIRLFASPNGLCSSITESKHIKAVKEPWRRSSRFEALVQMLLTNTRMDKLDAAGRAFTELGMMDGTTSSYTAMVLNGEQPQPRTMTADDDDEDDDSGPVTGPKSLSSIELARIPGMFSLSFSLHELTVPGSSARGYPSSVEALANHIHQPQFPHLLWRFLYNQVNPNADIPSNKVPIEDCPFFSGRISVYHSAVARFYAPSDLCGAGGMYQERIRSNPKWRGEYARYDTMFVETDATLHGMEGMAIGRALLLFSFKFENRRYPCALVNWFVPGNEPDDDTGMWVVQPEFGGNGRRTLAIIHLDCVARGAHLLPVYGSSFVPDDLHFSDSLDVFRAYFVNHYVDHHSHDFLT
jgi:hypothetical protein